jgi:hypothetical protein
MISQVIYRSALGELFDQGQILIVPLPPISVVHDFTNVSHNMKLVPQPLSLDFQEE